MFTIFAEAILKNGNSNTSIQIPTGQADTVVNSVLNVVYWGAGIVAVIVIIISGILYIISSGNPGQVAKAKNGIIAGVVGLILVLMAFAITGFVIGGF